MLSTDFYSTYHHVPHIYVQKIIIQQESLQEFPELSLPSSCE